MLFRHAARAALPHPNAHPRPHPHPHPHPPRYAKALLARNHNRSFGIPLLLIAWLAAGCVTTGSVASDSGELTLERSLDVGSATFRLRFAPEDEPTVQDVEAALAKAAPRVAVWGEMRETIELRIYPTHDALEIAVGRRNYPWLRAWARYDEIFLRSPRTFELFERGAGNLAELLTHELTHCLMYQRAAPKEKWRAADRSIPIWFREGMASYTARQGHRRMSEARLAEWRESTGRDPLGEAGALYQGSPEIAYAAAHWSFAFLVERYGAAAVGDTLDRMREERPFADAFYMVIGIPERTFVEEYLRYLDWGGHIDRRRPRASDVLLPPEAKPPL